MAIKLGIPFFKPKTHTSAPKKKVATKPKATVDKKASVDNKDKVETNGAAKALESIAVKPVAQAATLPTIAEVFPVQALEGISGKGISGQTFMLDGGSLRGLKLQIRRVLDGDKPGFEIAFKVTGSKLPGLIKKLEKAGATSTDLSFRGAEIGEDGITRLTSVKGSLSSSSTHAPPDIDNSAAQWVRRFEDPKGGVIEVVHDKAALAVRGLVRIQLQGDDKTCTKQLDGLLKAFGLQTVFAPPTQKSKQVHALMRVLWQVDYKQAEKLSEGDLEKIQPEELLEALKGAGYSKDRVQNLRYEETFPGHFSVVDPQQAEDLAKAGARYLYSTVTMPEHVLSILKNGQKSSLQRYEDGMIVNGMSTNADFTTGGAVGVFTRLVTQDAIYRGQSWTGRTYKIIQNYQQLGRTDWYGWNGDYFGRRWQLDSKVNFGRSLVESIDDGKSYKTTNELIFTAGNRPENIDRVVATTEADRQKLIALLEKEGYVPHNGLSISDFVLLAPKFMPFGPSPYDVSDPKQFAKEAMEAAKKGSSAQLRWFLIEAPVDPEMKAETEKTCLFDKELRSFLMDSLKVSGKLALSGEGLDKVLKRLQSKKTEDGPEILKALVKSGAEALFRSGSDEAAKVLEAHPSTSSWPGPYELADDNWVKILDHLLQQPGGKDSDCFKLALKTRGKALLDAGNAGFRKILQTHPLVTPANPDKWLADTLKKVIDDPKATEAAFDLSLFVAQAKPEHLPELRKTLLLANDAKAVAIVRSTLTESKDLGISAGDLKTLLDGLDAQSPSRTYLLGEVPDALLRLGDADLLGKVVAHHGESSPQMGISDYERWNELASSLVVKRDQLPAGYLQEVISRGAYYLQHTDDFLKKLPTLDGLFDLSNPEAFVQKAVTEWKVGQGGPIKLAWLLNGPAETQALKTQAFVATLESDEWSVKGMLSKIRNLSEKQALPLTGAQLIEVLEKLDPETKSAARTSFLSMAGKELLKTGGSKALELIKAHFEKTPSDDPAGQLGISYQPLRDTLDELAARTDDDGKAAYEWLVRSASPNGLRQSRPELIGHLQAKKLSAADLGLDEKAVLDLIKTIAKASYYYSEPATLAEGAKWLLFQNQTSPDDGLMEKIVKDLKSWDLDASKLKGFVAAMSSVASDWKEKLEKAAKG